jgi:hypothetical protein
MTQDLDYLRTKTPLGLFPRWPESDSCTEFAVRSIGRDHSGCFAA